MLTALKRLKKEAQQAQSFDDEYIKFLINPSNIREWIGFIKGPQDSAYDGFIFRLLINIDDDYPIAPPKLKFLTKIFHPNVLFSTGEICLDILKKEWSPVWNIQSACRAVVALLADPAPDRFRYYI
jgi:peroxin-4